MNGLHSISTIISHPGAVLQTLSFVCLAIRGKLMRGYISLRLTLARTILEAIKDG